MNTIGTRISALRLALDIPRLAPPTAARCAYWIARVQMANSLSRLRQSFGWSQDAMAATLGVSLRTIKRWEALEPPQTNPFLSFLWTSVSRYSNRLYRYGRVLLPQAYLDDVRASQAERSVYIGAEAVVLAMSAETVRTWGMFRYAEGLSVSAFSSISERALLAENYAEMKKISTDGDQSRIVNFVTRDAPPGSTPPLWRRHAMRVVFPEVFDMTSTPILEEEYFATEPKFWISAATETSPVVRSTSALSCEPPPISQSPSPGRAARSCH